MIVPTRVGYTFEGWRVSSDQQTQLLPPIDISIAIGIDKKESKPLTIFSTQDELRTLPNGTPLSALWSKVD